MTFSYNDLQVVDGEPHVSDAQLQEALGYSRIGTLRDLINKHLEELEGYGRIFQRIAAKNELEGCGAIVAQTAAKIGRGRPSKCFYLNEQQALLICMFSRTPKAAEARRQIIEVFVAWRRGELGARDVPPAPVNLNAQMAAGTERVHHSTEYLSSLDGLHALDNIAVVVTYLPIWPSNRRPNWWHDVEVRDFLTNAHRQMSSVRAEAEGQKRFPGRCPKKSAICAYWLRLDEIKQDCLNAHSADLGRTTLRRLN